MGRYEDMCEFMKKLVFYCCSQSPAIQLSEEERNLLSVAYKNVIGARRASWRALSYDGELVSEREKELASSYKAVVEKELQATCNEVLNLLEENLLTSCGSEEGNHESKVFYLKMIGD